MGSFERTPVPAGSADFESAHRERFDSNNGEDLDRLGGSGKQRCTSEPGESIQNRSGENCFECLTSVVRNID
jgi:hypothetical protein